VLLPAFLVLALAAAPAPQDAEERRSSLTGDIRHHRDFASSHLGNSRDLIVYLPPEYERETRRRYPVLYLHDGQNVFDGMTSFLPNLEWRADEAAEGLIRAGLIEPIIIVGIANAGAERANEYLPTRLRLRGGEEVGGRADLYGRMLVEEIKPFIDRTYRTRPDRRNTALGGSSFGGIVTLHLGLTRPDVFGKLAVLSPSVWWDDRLMVRRVRKLARKPDTRIWLDMGTAEGSGAVENSDLLRDALVERGWRSGRDLAYYVDHGAIHQEGAWASRMPAILMYLFGRR
jgi:predicted alpha/beta superfamily hydrolase